MIWATDENTPFSHNTKELELLWHDILNTTRQPEAEIVNALLTKPAYTREQVQRIQENARALIAHIRSSKLKQISIESFLKTHNLNSQEGLALMCLAEALLRIPDASTKTQLIRDKVSSGSWQNQDEDMFLKKFANLGLFTTGKFLSIGHQKGPLSLVASLVRRFGEPLIRQIMAQAVKIIAQQFVMGETIKKALDRATESEKKIIACIPMICWVNQLRHSGMPIVIVKVILLPVLKSVKAVRMRLARTILRNQVCLLNCQRCIPVMKWHNVSVCWMNSCHACSHWQK